jgi:hypothetical protein
LVEVAQTGRSRRNANVIVAASWATGIAAFAVVAGRATGAVDRCTTRHGYASVPFAFWPLLVSSVVLAASAALISPRQRATRLSLVGVILAALVSLVVFLVGYSCNLG